MKKRFNVIITILLVVVLAGIIFYPKIKPLLASKSNASGRSGPGSGPGMMQTRQLLNVSGFLIKPAQMSDPIVSTGTLRPDEEVEMSFETSGKIVGINFTEGTRVKQGDLLAKINDKPLQAQLQKLVAQRKLVEEKEFRQRSLLDKDAISQESYDQIVTELQTIEADINLVKARISETELHAPFDGIIVTAGAPEIPEALKKQLSEEGGRLVIPVGDMDMQRLAIIIRNGDSYTAEEIDGFKFVPLIGKQGWSQA